MLTVRIEVFWATNQSYISFSFTSRFGLSSENHNEEVRLWCGSVLPGGSPGSPGWSERCRRRSPRLSPPARNRSGPEKGRKTVKQRLRRSHRGWRLKADLQQQLSLREADSIHGGGGGGGGGGRRQRCGHAPKHDAALAVPAGAILAVLQGGCRRGEINQANLTASFLFQAETQKRN